MKFIILFSALFIILSCEKKELTENEILEIIHTEKNYDLMQLKTDFSFGQDFIDTIKAYKDSVANENFKPFYAADFNNDGKQDYFVNLTYNKEKLENDVIKIHVEEDFYQSALLLSQSDGYKILNPGKKMIYSVIGGKIINKNGQNLIKLLNFNKNYKGENNLLQIDTLMVKNGTLLEFNKKPSEYKIQKITLTKFGGYSPGIIYNLSLNNDSLTLNSKYYKKLKGKYKTKNSKKFKEISHYFNSIDFKNLKNHYKMMCNDCSAIETKIFYNQNQTKTIYDYGEKGSLGLISFYEKVDSQMENQKWMKVK